MNDDIPDHRIPAGMDFPAILGFIIANMEVFLYYYYQGCLVCCEDMSVLRVLLYGVKVGDFDETASILLVSAGHRLRVIFLSHRPQINRNKIK